MVKFAADLGYLPISDGSETGRSRGSSKPANRPSMIGSSRALEQLSWNVVGRGTRWGMGAVESAYTHSGDG